MESTLEFITSGKAVRERHRHGPDAVKAQIVSESLRPDVTVNEVARRKLVEITRAGPAPIAEEGVKRIGELYRIEAELKGHHPKNRLAGRLERSAPLIADMHNWIARHRACVAAKSPLGEALSYIAKYWEGLFASS